MPVGADNEVRRCRAREYVKICPGYCRNYRQNEAVADHTRRQMVTDAGCELLH